MKILVSVLGKRTIVDLNESEKIFFVFDFYKDHFDKALKIKLFMLNLKFQWSDNFESNIYKNPKTFW